MLKKMMKRVIAVTLAVTFVLMFMPPEMLGGFGRVFAKTREVYLKPDQDYNISNADKNTIVYINDDTAGPKGRSTVTLRGSSNYVWVHIALSSEKTVIVRLADGLNIAPGSDSAYGTGGYWDTLGWSRSGIYIDETECSGGTVVLMSEKGATVNIDSYRNPFPVYQPVPAIMKNDNKTALVFETEDKNDPGTIIARPTSGDGTVAIGAFGHGVLGKATSSYTVGKMIFHSGNIEAYGLDDGPGIGAYEYSHVDDMDFTGAHVIAKAGNARNIRTMTGAAGIGTAYRGNVGSITISAGYVEAWGQGSMNDPLGWPLMRLLDTCGVGIGGGWFQSNVGEIKITGGTVRAHGGSCYEGDQESSSIAGCGIGTTVNIYGKGGAGTADKITITGGDIEAYGGHCTAGIGGCVKEIEIAPATPDTKLKIVAGIDERKARNGSRHSLGSGIGACDNIGRSGFPGKITISGGDITATAGHIGDDRRVGDRDHFYGSGIGPNSYGKVESISITGGTIKAVGGWNSPGIGGPNFCEDGSRGNVGSIHISGGTVTATKATFNGRGGDGVPISGIGGYETGDSDRTDIRITGGSVISEGSDYAIGYDAAGQPENSAGDILYGTIFKFKPDFGEWEKLDTFSFDPALSYDYGLNDVYTKKGLGGEADNNIVEFWLPKSGANGYKCLTESKNHTYMSVDPEKVEAGDTTTLFAGTEITYENKVTGDTYTGLGIFGEQTLSIDPAPTATPRYSFDSYVDENGTKVAYGSTGDTELTLNPDTEYVDDFKWNAKHGKLNLYLNLERTHYVVKYDPNKPENASNDVEGTMEDSTIPVAGVNHVRQNEYSLKGWEFKGWYLNPEGTGQKIADQGEIIYDDWDTVTLYAHWEPRTYTVTFTHAASEGTGDPYTQDFVYDQPQALLPNTFTYDGHEFIGWEVFGQLGSYYINEAVVNNLCYVRNDGSLVGKTLEAEWIEADQLNLIIIDNDHFVTNAEADSITLKVGDNPIVASFTKTYWGYQVNNVPAGTYDVEFSNELMYYRAQEPVVVEEGVTSTYIWYYYSIEGKNDGHCSTTLAKGGVESNKWDYVPDKTTLGLKTRTAAGYKFDKYTTTGVAPTWEDNDRTKAEQNITVNGECVIQANTVPINYKVSFDKNQPDNATNNVEGSMDDMDFIYDEEQELIENGFSLKHWKFTGWNTKKDGSGTALTDKQSAKNLTTTDGGTAVLYAQWEPETYTVYYSATEATSGIMLPQTIEFDNHDTLSHNYYERTDWHFTGWNTEPHGGGTAYEDGQDVFNITENKNVTLYAQWEHDYYTVKFDKNAATAIGEMDDEAIWTNSHYHLPLITFTNPGYTFTSWNTKPDGSGTEYTDGEAIENAAAKDETMTLYAQWKANKYVVTFDPNSGEGTMDDQDFVYDVPQELSENTYTREHFVFKGWNTRSDGTGESFEDKGKVENLTTNPDQTVTLFAQWELETHTISYDLNGGTLFGQTGIVEAHYSYGDTVMLPEPTREGYDFDYWEGSKYYAGDAYTVTEDHTLKAIWKESKGEKTDDKGDGGHNVKTGDETNAVLWFGLLAVSMAGIVGVIFFRKKRKIK